MAGTDMREIVLKGDPKNPEKTYAQIRFPGGVLYCARCDDGSYWAHITINHADHTSFDPFTHTGHIVDGRLDLTTKSAIDVNTGDFDNPSTYHVAIRVGHTPPKA